MKMQKSNFLHICKSQIYSKLSVFPHRFLIFTATNITCTLPFIQPLAAASTHCNFDFAQNRILRLIKSFPFAPVQNMAVRIAALINFCKKS